MKQITVKDPDVYFVTGTDTGIGKTLTTAVLLRLEQLSQRRVIGLKPIASGCTDVEGQLRNVDADVLKCSGSVSLPYQSVNPISLDAPVSPHLLIRSNQQIAALVADPIKFAQQCMAEVPKDLDAILIEGAGGWRAPLTDTLYMSDLAKCFTTQVVLVVGMRLGCLNHALLTVEAIQKDGCEVVGWIANCLDSNMSALEENIETLESRLPFPRLLTLPALSPDVSIQPLNESCQPLNESCQPLNESYSQIVDRELQKVDSAMKLANFNGFQSLM